MGAEPAYQRYSNSAYNRSSNAYARVPERIPTPARSPRIQVVPGRGREAAPSALPSQVVFLAKTAAAVLVVLALVGFARVFLSSATVTTSMQSQELSSQIDSARAQGNQLEVTQSSLSNPTRVKTEAGAMGMTAAGDTVVIDLAQDVVATDESGNLSLSKSLRLAAEA